MKLSEILGWPEKKNDKVQFIHEDSVEDTDIILKPERAHNSALTSYDRDIDREALAKIMSENIYLLSSKDMAERIISTMPKWLKKVEK